MYTWFTGLPVQLELSSGFLEGLKTIGVNPLNMVPVVVSKTELDRHVSVESIFGFHRLTKFKSWWRRREDLRRQDIHQCEVYHTSLA